MALFKTMNNNVHQVELHSMVIGNKNSPRTSKVRWHPEVSSIGDCVRMV